MSHDRSKPGAAPSPTAAPTATPTVAPGRRPLTGPLQAPRPGAPKATPTALPMPMLTRASELPVSHGDEAGSGGGVVSGGMPGAAGGRPAVHVVQGADGRVVPLAYKPGGLGDTPDLEAEADAMGAQAVGAELDGFREGDGDLMDKLTTMPGPGAQAVRVVMNQET